MPLYVSIRQPISITLAKVFDASQVWDYFWNSGGLLAFPPVAGVEFQDTSALMLFSMGTANERLLRDLSNYHPQVFRDTFPFYNDTSKEGFMFLATCLQPRSRGTVTLRDSSISIQPVVDPNYLHSAWDVRCIVKALRRAERLVETEPFKNIGARIHWPRPERCLSFWNYSRTDQTGILPKRSKKYVNQASQSSKPKPKGSTQDQPKKASTQTKPKSPPDEYLECIIREVAVTGHHVAGTCAGGAVVDDQLRVRTVSGVRIMDASVLPSPLSLYPNSVLIAMAEKAADLIRNTQIQ
ncbi:GMC oxidoreductase domain-containing protein [Phthorimaea operculella]|nr:GMC oxidoreductase domain-containing protein [Phthorimaea operculella]